MTEIEVLKRALQAARVETAEWIERCQQAEHYARMLEHEETKAGPLVPEDKTIDPDLSAEQLRRLLSRAWAYATRIDSEYLNAKKELIEQRSLSEGLNQLAEQNFAKLNARIADLERQLASGKG